MLQKKVVRSILNLIPNGQLFVVRFQKRDGEERTMTCQKGVRKHVKGTGANRAKPEDLQTVHTPDGYRSFNVNRVYEIRALGCVIKST